MSENFRVAEDGATVEVDVTLTVDSDVVMHGWPELGRVLLGLHGVRAVRVDDLPPALVERSLLGWGS